jgi:hypothetical protein
VDDPTTGFNILKTNGGYDLYVETPATFVDTIWAQNNAWTHNGDAGVANFDIYDVNDDPTKARVIFVPVMLLDADEGQVPVPETLVRISPNPTDGRFTIQTLWGSEPVSRIELRDMAGRVVARLSIPESSSGMAEFNISQVPAGVYPVRMYPESESGTKGMVLIKR